jgi:hypothetical protein
MPRELFVRQSAVLAEGRQAIAYGLSSAQFADPRFPAVWQFAARDNCALPNPGGGAGQSRATAPRARRWSRDAAVRRLAIDRHFCAAPRPAAARRYPRFSIMDCSTRGAGLRQMLRPQCLDTDFFLHRLCRRAWQASPLTKPFRPSSGRPEGIRPRTTKSTTPAATSAASSRSWSALPMTIRGADPARSETTDRSSGSEVPAVPSGSSLAAPARRVLHQDDGRRSILDDLAGGVRRADGRYAQVLIPVLQFLASRGAKRCVVAHESPRIRTSFWNAINCRMWRNRFGSRS